MPRLPLCLTLLALLATPLYAQPAPQSTVIPQASYHFHRLQIGGGGFITGILFHPAVPGLAYVRTDIGGIYRSTDSGANWTPLTDWVQIDTANLLGGESFAVDPAHPDDLYIAAGTYTHPGVPDGALLRSHDRGAHFQVIPLPFQLGGNEPSRFAGERLTLDPHTPGTLYLGTRNNGLWRSRDHGTTWAQVTSFPSQGSTGIGILFVAPAPTQCSPTSTGPCPTSGFSDVGSSVQHQGNNTLYVGVSDPQHSLYASHDDGLTWQSVPNAPTGLIPYHAAFDATGALYLTYGNAPGPNDVTRGAVFRRTPDGTFTDITPVPNSAGSDPFAYAGLTVQPDSDPSHPAIVMVSTLDRWHPGDTVFRSTDSGHHWTSLKEQAQMDSSFSPFLRDAAGHTPFGHWLGSIAVDPYDPNHLLYGTGETLWGTHDLTAADRNHPTHFTVAAHGIEETAILDLLSQGQPANHLFAALGDIGCFRAESASAGVEAQTLNGLRLSNCDSIAIAAQNPAVLAAVGRTWHPSPHGGTSHDGGRTWQPFATEPAAADHGGSVALAADGRTAFWTTTQGVSLSTDLGHTWHTVATGAHLQLAADPLHPQRAYLLNPGSGELTALTWAAQTPDRIAHTPLLNFPAGMHLTVTPAGKLWLYGEAGLFALDEAHHSMTRVPTVQRADTIAFGTANSGAPEPIYLAGKIAADSSAALLVSHDNGLHWSRVTNRDHGFGYITTLAVDATTPDRVYIGTNGLGVIVGEAER